MKKQFLMAVITFLTILNVSAQKGSYHLVFSATDTVNNTSVTPDSILIHNQTQGGDTLLIGGVSEIDLLWPDLVREHLSPAPIGVQFTGANPFVSETKYNLVLHSPASISTRLYDGNSRVLAKFDGEFSSGVHHFQVTASHPGVYVLMITNGKQTVTKKLICKKGSPDRRCSIAYRSYNNNNTLKETRANDMFRFIPGDTLVYTFYNSMYTPSTLTHAPDGNQEYTFIMQPNFLDFSSDTTSGYVPLKVQFYSQTNMSAKSWHWEFGDGLVSDEQFPQHTFLDENRYYTVSLKIVDNQNTTHIRTKENYIHTLPTPATVHMNADITEGFAPQTIHFTATTNINATYWQWGFGDGEGANVQNPYHEYVAPGTYTVTVQVFSENGTVSETKEDFIHIGNCPPTINYAGNIYSTEHIGNQCWIKNNLNVGLMINGEELGEDNDIVEKWCYDDDENNCNEYGALYSYDEAINYNDDDQQGICPEGWHIPDLDEWLVLFNFLGGQQMAGGKMKETGTLHWLYPNIGATNESRFTALGSGIRVSSNPNYLFKDLKKIAHFWISQTSAYYNTIYLNYTDEKASIGSSTFSKGHSVRCIKNVE